MKTENPALEQHLDQIGEHDSIVDEWELILLGNDTILRKLHDLKSLIAPEERTYNKYDQALISKDTLQHWVDRLDEIFELIK
jgi:hypothetical protein